MTTALATAPQPLQQRRGDAVPRRSRVMGIATDLPPAAIEQVARRVVELLTDPHPTSAGRLIGAGAVARHFGLTRTWVYQHADHLGAIRIGDGERPRLRFHIATVADRLTAQNRYKAPNPAPARRQAAPAARQRPRAPCYP